MQQDGIEPLIEAIYDASLDPAAWRPAMALMGESFDAGAACLYCLDYRRRHMRPVEVTGIAPRFLGSFEASFYTDDNPGTRTPSLHRPGVVRTERSFDEYLGGVSVLRQSRYYHEWLQPQDFAHTMGMTPLAQEDHEDGPGRGAGNSIVFNLSLLRSAAVGPFRVEEVQRFARLQVHLSRALRISQRLESLAAGGGATAAALDRLVQAVVFVSGHGHILHCNAAAEALLRAGAGLRLSAGRLSAANPATQQGLDRLLRQTQDLVDAGETLPSLPVPRSGGQGPLLLSALPLSARAGRFVTERASVMLLIADPAVPRGLALDLLPVLYGLTPAEVRLARQLLAGEGLRVAAARAGMTYETGRWYLKVLLQKTHTCRQAELIARLHADLGRGY